MNKLAEFWEMFKTIPFNALLKENGAPTDILFEWFFNTIFVNIIFFIWVLYTIIRLILVIWGFIYDDHRFWYSNDDDYCLMEELLIGVLFADVGIGAFLFIFGALHYILYGIFIAWPLWLIILLIWLSKKYINRTKSPKKVNKLKEKLNNYKQELLKN